ncbi:MAG TPA: ATP-dependent sacrificial sulfur transferase LarE [Chthonomonadales bacterium]|nr:ATP-dependent sacrificial sulfur transferase LarE [Chthonomonadales bacterium]
MSLETGAPPLDASVKAKLADMRSAFRAMGSVVVGYSGGVDSTVVARVAHEELGERAIAVIGDSEAFPLGEVEAALEAAARFGIEVVRVTTHEMRNPNFRINTPDRCYHCKSELFSVLASVAASRGIAFVADGSNADDVSDHRPGMRAAGELGVRSPLLEAGITKAEVRKIARHLGLPNWDRPSFACLSSRFPYGTEITRELLERVDACERTLRELGFRQFRVRHHDTTCRIELEPPDLARALELRGILVERFRAAGYLYVALDLEGFRSGKMNDGLASGSTVPTSALRRTNAHREG